MAKKNAAHVKFRINWSLQHAFETSTPKPYKLEPLNPKLKRLNLAQTADGTGSLQLHLCFADNGFGLVQFLRSGQTER